MSADQSPLFGIYLTGNARGHGSLLNLRMVDWSEPKKPVGEGLGGDRGQVCFVHV